MSQVFRLHQWRVDPSLRTLTGVRGDVHVEPKQMQVLVQLAEHPGQLVSKQKLLQTVWQDTFVGDEVLSRAISELRRVLEDDPKAPRYIQTIPKSGYRLIAPVTVDRPEGEEHAGGSAPESLPELTAASPARPTLSVRGVIFASVPAVLVVVAVLGALPGRWQPPRTAVRTGDLARQGLQLISHDKHAAAAALASEAIRADPRAPLPHLVFAWAMNNQGAAPQAYLSSAKEAVALAEAADDRETYYFARASYWHMKGDLAQAARDYETLLKLTPDHYWGLNNLLGIYEALGRDEWRQLAARRADASPENVTDQVIAARVLFITGDLVGAERYAERACHTLAETSDTETSFGEPWACAAPAYVRWVDGRVPEVRAAVIAVVRRSGLQRPERDMALHTVLGAALGIGDWQLAELAASSIEEAPTRLQDQAAIALVRGEWSVARRLVMDESVGTTNVMLSTAAIMSDVGLGRSVLDRFGVEPSDSSTDAEYLRAEQAWSQRRYAEAMQHVRRTMSGPSGAFTGTGGRSTVALLRSLTMMAEDEERQEELTEAIVHLEEARALRREACLGDPLAPAYWLRAQVRLAGLYRRAGRSEEALRTEGVVDTLTPRGTRSIFYPTVLPAQVAALR